MLPHEWLSTAYADKDKRQTYIGENDLDALPESIPEFMTFYERRKDLLRTRLLKALGVTEAAPTAASTE